MNGCKGGQGRPAASIVDNAVAVVVVALGYVAVILLAGK